MPDAVPLKPQPALPPGVTTLSSRLRLAVLPPCARVRLQLGPREQPAAGALRIAGVPLPVQINRWCGPEPVISRLAPELWIVQAAAMEATQLATAVATACAGRTAAITDVSDALVTFALSGGDAVALLARGCCLDLALAAFPPDGCTRTRFAQLAVILRRSDSDGFELTVETPAARWLCDWIVDAAVGLDCRE